MLILGGLTQGQVKAQNGRIGIRTAWSCWPSFQSARLKGEKGVLFPNREGGGVEDISSPLIK